MSSLVVKVRPQFPSCVAAPTADVPLPSLTSELDWEVELAVVMGR